MSHVASVDLKVTDLDVLEAACKEFGAELVRGDGVHDLDYQWYGAWLNDWNDPERAAALRGHDPATFGKAKHKIRVAGASYEIGLVPRLDGGKGYDAIYDAFGQGMGLEGVFGSGLVKLRKTLAEKVVLSQFARSGYTARVTTNAQGQRQIIGLKY